MRALALLFTLTGMTALLIEQAFERLLSSLLGASTPAAAVVLAVYFAGLTIGGLLYGRRRWRNPVRVYAVLEATVACWALLLAAGGDRLIPLAAPLLGLAGDNFLLLQSGRVVLAALWILPVTIPMGASFPAIVDALERSGLPDRGQAVARFYACNLLGAILGAALGPFAFFPALGLDGTMVLGAAVNITVALVALRLTPATVATGVVCLESTAAPVSRKLLGVAFTSGFVFFGLEVVWAHLIAAVLGNSVYAFAAMLTIVLAALGLGGWLTARRFPGHKTVPVREISRLLLVGAIILALLNAFWPDVPQLLALAGANLTSFAAAETLKWSVAAVMILPGATLLGMVYPALFRSELFPAQRQGRAAGRMLAANAVGCIAGALAAGFGLLPLFGSERTLQGLTLLCLAWGLLLASQRRLWWYGIAGLAVLAIQPAWDRLHLTSGRHVYFRQAEVNHASRLGFFHEDTHGGFTTVVENQLGGQPYRTLLTNGKFQGNDAWERDAQRGFALAPLQFVRHFDAALVIGLGTGQSAAIVNQSGFRSIDIAEIAPGIVQAAAEHFAHVNDRVLERPHVQLFLEDGRQLLLRRSAAYDLITMEISSVWFAGATSLYSEEFYRLAERRLRPGGVLQQWVQLHHIRTEEVLTVIATLRAVFPHVSLWVIGGQGVLVATREPQTVTEAFRRQSWPAEWLVEHPLLTATEVDRLVTRPGLVRNTDRNRRLEWLTPRLNYSRLDHAALNIAALKALAQPADKSARSNTGTRTTPAAAAATAAPSPTTAP